MEYYWDEFNHFLQGLEKQKTTELVKELIDARQYVNGLTDGWYEYLAQLRRIEKDYKSNLSNEDFDKLKYFENTIDKMLKNR